MEWAIAKKITEVVICSDSQSVLKRLCNLSGSNSFHPNSFIVKIMENLSIASIHNINFYFLWVKAHANIPGNVKVDYIARNTNIATAKKDISIVSSDFYSVVKNYLMHKWNLQWQEYGAQSNTFYYSIHPKIPMSHWYSKCSLSRKTISTISRIKLNHGKFPVHLHRIGVRDDPHCPCGAIGDVNHFIFNCPLNEINSNIFLNFLHDNGFISPIWLPHLLSLPNPNFMRNLASFFFKSNIDI